MKSPKSVVVVLSTLAQGVRDGSASAGRVHQTVRRVLAAMGTQAVDGLTAAIEAAWEKSQQDDPEDRIGQQYAAEHEGLWQEHQAEVTIEFPDDGDAFSVIVVRGGDGEPVGYQGKSDIFSAGDAAQAVLDLLAKE